MATVWAALLFTALHRTNASTAWAWFGVPDMGAPYSDLYPFPAAQQTLAEGGVIYRPMAVEHWHRPYNYPALWLSFMRFSEQQIPWLGTAMIAACLAMLAAACGRLDLRQGFFLGLFLCAPPMVLALERGNTDVIVFSIVAAGLVLLHRNQNAWSWTCFTVAAVLKLFPAFAFGCFLRLGWRRATPWLIAAIAGIGLLTSLQLDEMRGVLRETPAGGMLSYGSTVWIRVANLLSNRGTSTSGVFDDFLLPVTVCGALLAGTAFLSGMKCGVDRAQPAAPDAALDSFRAGAGIYLATFLVGGHFCYRLIFLLLCVPWLTRRTPPPEADVQRGRQFTLAVMALALWSNPTWSTDLYYVREIGLWALMIVMAWLLGRTLPLADLPELARRLLRVPASVRP